MQASCALLAWSACGAHAADHVLSVTLSEYAPEARLVALDGVREDRRSALKIAQRLGLDISQAVEVVNNQATLASIRQALDMLERNVNSNDRVFFFYSGHGGSKRVDNTCQSSLVTYEDEDLLSSELDERLARIRGKLPSQIFVLIDACHSGEFVDRSVKAKGFGEESFALRPKMRTKSKDGQPVCKAPVNHASARLNAVNKLEKGRSVSKGTFNEASGGQMVMLSAARDNELAWDSDRGGAATGAALSCLADSQLQSAQGSGYVSVDELSQCMQGKINHEQTLAIRQHVVAYGQTTAHWIPTVAASSNINTTLQPATQHLVAAPAAVPSLQTAVLIAGMRFENPEVFALPSDSVFALNLNSDHSGSATVYAINPAGQTNEIWSTQLVAKQAQQTPDMRLEGMRGRETLRIVFKADAPTTLAGGATVTKDISILHQ